MTLTEKIKFLYQNDCEPVYNGFDRTFRVAIDVYGVSIVSDDFEKVISRSVDLLLTEKRESENTRITSLNAQLKKEIAKIKQSNYGYVWNTGNDST